MSLSKGSEVTAKQSTDCALRPINQVSQAQPRARHQGSDSRDDDHEVRDVRDSLQQVRSDA